MRISFIFSCLFIVGCANTPQYFNVKTNTLATSEEVEEIKLHCDYDAKIRKSKRLAETLNTYIISGGASEEMNDDELGKRLKEIQELEIGAKTCLAKSGLKKVAKT